MEMVALAWRDDDRAQILRESKVIAVVGLSNDRFRPSWGVAHYLQQEGYRIIPVNPHEASVLGETSYPSLQDVPEKVDVVDVFRRPQFVDDIVDQAVAVGAKTIWLQRGVGTVGAAERARQAGLKVVLNQCMATELHKLHAAAAE
jgi:predicted CoA-binding protein